MTVSVEGNPASVPVLFWPLYLLRVFPVLIRERHADKSILQRVCESVSVHGPVRVRDAPENERRRPDAVRVFPGEL
jgi:hypothetical protein